MPRPFNERQSLEQERAEISGQIAAYRQELENASYLSRARRERLDWQIREREKRLAEVETRLRNATCVQERKYASVGPFDSFALREASMILRALVVVALMSSIEFLALPAALAMPITSITGLNNFRDTRGLNDVGVLRRMFEEEG
jgi:hypothetical protein